MEAQAWIRTSVLISPEFYEAVKKARIRFSEAMRCGIVMLLAEKGVMEYDNRLNIVRKRNALIQQLEETAGKLNNLKEKEECQTKTTSKEEEKNTSSAKN